MKIRFTNNIQTSWFVLLFSYFLTLIVIFYVFEFHLTSIGDYRSYGSGKLHPGFSPESLTTNIFTCLSFIGLTPIIIGLILLSYISYYFLINVKPTIINIFIFFSILNPYAVQFLVYPSKELLLIIFTVLIFKFKDNFLLIIFFLSVLFLIRPMFFLVPVTFVILINKKFFKLKVKSFLYLVILCSILGLLYIENTKQIPSLIVQIERSFLPYATASTNRDWIPSVETIYSKEFITWLSIGVYTLFFGFFNAPSIYSSILFIIAGLGKVLLFYKLYKISKKYYYLWIINLIIYGVPLSVYNVGSSLRYSTPIMVIMLYSFAILRKEIINERR